ncbi:hypothetical protein P8452_43940 [Trifolium repens]|nr:hypothetical protein P8452_43940 [Trifolium repens]
MNPNLTPLCKGKQLKRVQNRQSRSSFMWWTTRMLNFMPRSVMFILILISVSSSSGAASMFTIGSTSPAALMYDALDHFDRRSTKKMMVIIAKTHCASIRFDYRFSWNTTTRNYLRSSKGEGKEAPDGDAEETSSAI